MHFYERNLLRGHEAACASLLIVSLSSVHSYCHLCCTLGIQDSQGDQLIADGISCFKINSIKSIKQLSLVHRAFTIAEG